MSTDSFFRMTVQIEAGTLKVGDEIFITHPGYSKKVAVTGIEMLPKQIQQVQAGDNVGILLRDVSKSDVQQGDVLIGSGVEFRWNS